MSEDPNADVSSNGSRSDDAETPPPGDNVADLKREVERLRAQLAKATTEADTYRQAAYALLEQLDPHVPPTEEELQELMHGPRGRSILDIINELEGEAKG